MLQWRPVGPAQTRVETGALRIDAVPASWGTPDGERAGEFLRVVDLRSGDVVGDLRSALASELIDAPWVGARTHLRFRLSGSDQILIVDADADRCRLAGGPWQPLSTMQAQIDAALEAMRSMGARRQLHSPDGRIRIDYFEYEHRNNEWLPSPEILDLDTGTVVLRETHRISNARHVWVAPGRLSLVIENAFLPVLTVELDLDAGTCRLGDASERAPIAEARSRIESWVSKQERRVEGTLWPTPAPSRTLRDAFRSYDWRFALIATALATLFLLALLISAGVL